MFKKIIGSILSAAMIAAFFCIGSVPVSADTYDVYKGDTVQYIFSIGAADNVAGVAVDSWYNAEYLSPVDGVLHVGSGYVNTAYAAGAIKWNFIVYGGRAFNNEDVVTITFDVLKSGSISDLGLSYDCVECFNHELESVVDNFNSLVTARVEVIPTGDHTSDITTDSDSAGQSETDTNNGNDQTSTDTKNDTSNDTETDTKVNTDTSSDVKTTDSDKAKTSDSDSESDKSSDTGSDQSTDTSSDSSKTETELTPETADTSTDSSASSNSDSSDTDSNKQDTSNSSDSSSSTNNTNGNASVVQTAGKIAIAAVVLIFAGAGGVLFFIKKKELNN